MANTRREKKQFEHTFPFFTWNNGEVDFPPHWHDCFELIYMRRGRVCASIDDTVYEANPGDLIMVNAGSVHGFFDQSADIDTQCFQFDITFFGEDFVSLREEIFNTPLVSVKTVPPLLAARRKRLIDEIAVEWRSRLSGYQLAIKAKFYELMLTILRAQARTAAKPRPSSARRIMSFVFKNFSDDTLTLESAAGSLNLNKFYFTRFFKKHTGQSFHAYLTKTRVDFAKRYLIESKMPITDIAFSAGFGSLQTFNRVFKTLTGRTPSVYRRENSSTLSLGGPASHFLSP